MLIGILSDSHGDAAATARAIELLKSRGAAKLFHCGDVCSDLVLDELAGHDAVFVWGNCDAPSQATCQYVESLGLPIPRIPVTFNADGKRISVWHGHERDFASAVQGGEYDYVFYGHTHRFADDRVGTCRVINPGALHRASIKTVALLNTESDELIFLNLDDGRVIEPARRTQRAAIGM